MIQQLVFDGSLNTIHLQPGFFLYYDLSIVLVGGDTVAESSRSTCINRFNNPKAPITLSHQALADQGPFPDSFQEIGL